MLRLAAKFQRAVRNGISPSFSLLKPPPPPPQAVAPQPVRHFSVKSSDFTLNPVAVEMIKHAISLARDQKTEESYARGLKVLEQCESTQPDDNSKGLVGLACSTLLYERGSNEAAIEKLVEPRFVNLSIAVATYEALAGIYLEHCWDIHASAYASFPLQRLEFVRQETRDRGGIEALEARLYAIKGLTWLLCGNLDSVLFLQHNLSIFESSQGDRFFAGSAALCYGECLHSLRKFSTAKEVYTKVIKDVSEIKEFCDPNNLGACNMTSEEVAIAAACALGQLEAHMGNFSDAEEILTAALKKTEERLGSHHPKVGVILTCIALMYRLKATTERSSYLLIQEGLFRKALELLKAPPMLDAKGRVNVTVLRRDIITLARVGYAETLGVQQSRKDEAEELKSWAEAAWASRWMSSFSLRPGEPLDLSESTPKLLIIDTRICRAIY